MHCKASPGAQYQRPALYCREEFPQADTEMPKAFAYPEKTLTSHTDLTLLPRRIVLNTNDSSVHSLTFRRRRLNYHGGIKHIEDDLYKPRHDEYKKDSRTESDPLYYVDTEHPDIFGHFLIEVVPDLWAVNLLGDHKLKIATSVKMNRSYLAMLGTLGIRPERIVHIDAPIKAKEVLAPTVMVQRRRYLDPACLDVFDRIRSLSWTSKADIKSRIYISRSKAPGRQLVNEKDVEAIFEQFGFTIIHPQELQIEDQIKLFANAELIAGSGGSAMHNTIYSSDTSKVLILCSPTWMVLADSLICQQPHQLGYVFGQVTENSEGKGERHKGEWRINLDDVRTAIRGHFDL